MYLSDEYYMPVWSTLYHVTNMVIDNVAFHNGTYSSNYYDMYRLRHHEMTYDSESMALARCVLSKNCITQPATPVVCEEGSYPATFTRISGENRCFVKESDSDLSTNGYVLISYVTDTTICLSSGYYLIGCDGDGIMNVKILNYNVLHDLSVIGPHYKILSFSFSTN